MNWLKITVSALALIVSAFILFLIFSFFRQLMIDGAMLFGDMGNTPETIETYNDSPYIGEPPENQQMITPDDSNYYDAPFPTLPHGEVQADEVLYDVPFEVNPDDTVVLTQDELDAWRAAEGDS